MAESATVEWTGRRRLLEVLTGGAADRVPVNTYELPGRDSRDWYARQPSYAPLLELIRARTDCITNWGPRPVSIPELPPGAFAASGHPVHVEVREEEAGPGSRITRIVHSPQGPLRSVTSIDPAVNTTWRVEHFCKSTDDVDRALTVPYEPVRFDASDHARVRAELGEAGLVMASLADPAYLAADLMSYEEFLLWASQETAHFARTVDALAERVLENLRQQLACCTVDVYRIVGPEYFTPPSLPPALFERFVVPHVRRMTEEIHAHGARVRLHCHGRIGRVLEHILETGCDGIDPCEGPPSGDVELGEVKRRCASAGVSVWGNLQLRVLETATPDEVRREVRSIKEQAAGDGGFVLMPTASPIHAPLEPAIVENYRAFIEAGLETGRP